MEDNLIPENDVKEYQKRSYKDLSSEFQRQYPRAIQLIELMYNRLTLVDKLSHKEAVAKIYNDHQHLSGFSKRNIRRNLPLENSSVPRRIRPSRPKNSKTETGKVPKLSITIQEQNHGIGFRPINGIEETCSKECRTHLKRKRERKWEESNNEKRNTQDVVRSQNIQKQWTTQTGKWWWLSDSWKIAEEKSVDILRLEGYDNIQLWTAQAARFPFDISASKDGKEHLFQVTTNLTAKKTAAHKFAIRYGLNHKILYISVETNRYIIKDFPKCGSNKLTVKDLNNALTFV